MSIIVNNISKKFGEQWAVKHVSFQVKSGEILGFIGPNGAGKSTTMKIITGFLPPTKGSVMVNGLNSHEHPMAIKRVIGYLPESNPLYPDMYVREYLHYVAGLYGIKGNEAKQRIKDIISQVGLLPEQHKKIGKLSKGFKQRVGISQALIHNPDVLILDEPTSGLDPNQIVEIRNLISTVGKEKTVLLSTHIMQEVEAICDRVIIIDGGIIKADDDAGKLANDISKGQTIEIELEANFDPEKWMELSGITEVREVGNNKYLLASSSDEDVRSRIFRFAVENQLTILSLNQRKKNLEEVFRELTRKST